MSMLTTAEAAEALGITRRTVQAHIKSGRLAGVWDRGQLRIDPAELERFKRERQVGPGRPHGSKDRVPRTRRKRD